MSIEKEVTFGMINIMSKRPIKFNITLSEEQKEVKSSVLDYDINFLLGDEGSGKTMLAVNIALDLFFRKDTHYKQIIITRPAVSTEDHGFIPGDLKEKMHPYLVPIYETINDLYGDTDSKKNKIKKHMESEEIRILPIGFTRGVTYKDAIIIVDEFQNCNNPNLQMVIGRLGPTSKLIFSGSRKQIDLKNPAASCIHSIDKLTDNEYVNIQTLKANHRHPSIVSVLKDLRDEKH
jgi:phosphate starvation-inducible protein PhoH and related proteins